MSYYLIVCVRITVCVVITLIRRMNKMIKSMTGFGRCEVVEGTRKICIEMKTVNHRYLDINMKIPKKLNFFEASIRTRLKNYIDRGKVDIFITYEDLSESNIVLRYNEQLAHEYMQYFERMSKEFDIENDIKVSDLSRCPEVLTMEEQNTDEDELLKIVEKALDDAGNMLVEARTAEGEHLKHDLMDKLDYMLMHIEYISEKSPELIKDYQNKLEEKVKELLDGTQIDDSRIASEVIIYADKICVDEEVVRLLSHVKAMKKALTEGGSIGRKLDFIAQEMNREANTILSKANDLDISNRAIELKTDIEKVREQVQNIE